MQLYRFPKRKLALFVLLHGLTIHLHNPYILGLDCIIPIGNLFLKSMLAALAKKKAITGALGNVAYMGFVI